MRWRGCLYRAIAIVVLWSLSLVNLVHASTGISFIQNYVKEDSFWIEPLPRQ